MRGYLVGCFRPNPLLAPFHVISGLSRTLALSMRLYGNMMSGHRVVALTGFLVPMPLMALDDLIGLLQGYISAILARVYVGAAIRAGEVVAPPRACREAGAGDIILRDEGPSELEKRVAR
jgi:F-type H+-transporting ATPase subunit a